MKEETTDSLCASAVGAPATFKSCPNETGKNVSQHDKVLLARMITDIKGTSP
jgi:hypothetical protein